MLKKENTVKWTEDAMKYFNLVKLALTTAPVLISPNYTHDFIIFSLTSKHALAVVLMQKKDQGINPLHFSVGLSEMLLFSITSLRNKLWIL